MVDYYEESIGVKIGDDSDETDEFGGFDDENLNEIPLYENSAFVKSPHGKAYAVIRHADFRPSELMQLLAHICKAEILSSVFFIVHGSVCPGYSVESQYETVCHMNVVAGLVGIMTGGFGLGAVCKHQKARESRGMSMLYLLFCIISSVAFLLVVVNSALWLAKISEADGRKDWGKMVGGLMILAGTALGVCFIISSTFVCYQWNANQKQIHIVGTVARSKYRVRQRATVRYRKSSPVAYHNLAGSTDSMSNTTTVTPTDTSCQQQDTTSMQYQHVCTSRCRHIN